MDYRCVFLFVFQANTTVWTRKYPFHVTFGQTYTPNAILQHLRSPICLSSAHQYQQQYTIFEHILPLYSPETLRLQQRKPSFEGFGSSRHTRVRNVIGIARFSLSRVRVHPISSDSISMTTTLLKPPLDGQRRIYRPVPERFPVNFEKGTLTRFYFLYCIYIFFCLVGGFVLQPLESRPYFYLQMSKNYYFINFLFMKSQIPKTGDIPNVGRRVFPFGIFP